MKRFFYMDYLIVRLIDYLILSKKLVFSQSRFSRKDAESQSCFKYCISDSFFLSLVYRISNIVYRILNL